MWISKDQKAQRVNKPTQNITTSLGSVNQKKKLSNLLPSVKQHRNKVKKNILTQLLIYFIKMLIKKSTSVTRGCSLLIPLCVAVKVTAIFWFFFLKHTLQTSFPHSPVEYEIVKRHPSTKQNKHTVISLNTKPTDR